MEKKQKNSFKYTKNMEKHRAYKEKASFLKYFIIQLVYMNFFLQPVR